MLPAMFGMGGTEILVILIVALLFLGPEKLPDAATKISKGIREMRKQTRDVTQTIENDTQIGGAIRDLKSALRGDPIHNAVRAATNPNAAEKKPGTKKKKKKKKKPATELADARPPRAARRRPPARPPTTWPPPPPRWSAPRPR